LIFCISLRPVGSSSDRRRTGELLGRRPTAGRLHSRFNSGGWSVLLHRGGKRIGRTRPARHLLGQRWKDTTNPDAERDSPSLCALKQVASSRQSPGASRRHRHSLSGLCVRHTSTRHTICIRSIRQRRTRGTPEVRPPDRLEANRLEDAALSKKPPGRRRHPQKLRDGPVLDQPRRDRFPHGIVRHGSSVASNALKDQVIHGVARVHRQTHSGPRFDIQSAPADEIAIVIVDPTPAWTTVSTELSAAVVSVAIFALRGNTLLVISDDDVLAAIDITSAWDGAATTPTLPGKALKTTITIEYLSAACTDINLTGSEVGTVLRFAVRRQHRILKALDSACLSIAPVGRIGRVCNSRKARNKKSCR